MTQSQRIIDCSRNESDDCQRLTPGCSIDHTVEWFLDPSDESPCETW